MSQQHPPRAEWPMCDAVLRFRDLGSMESCPECTASFRKMAICAIVAQTAMTVEMRECYAQLEDLGKEIQKLQTLIAAFDAAYED